MYVNSYVVYTIDTAKNVCFFLNKGGLKHNRVLIKSNILNR
jgi:hypothetical protein